MSDLTPDQEHALDIARRLAAAGVPVFVAYPDPTSSTGFRLPKGWQTTTANPRYVDAWRPGMALCAVMGHVLDLVDIDPRNGSGNGSAGARLPKGVMPRVYATAATPSGGWHRFVKSLGVRSRDGIVPGVDIKAGVDGQGHGFAFIAPTARASKVTGELVAYRWQNDPKLEWLRSIAEDTSGDQLAAMVRAAHGKHADADQLDQEVKPSPWDDVIGLLAQGRHDAVYKLACALRGRGGWRAGDAIEYMRAVVWPLIDQGQGGHPYTVDEFEADITDAFTRNPDGPSPAPAAATVITEPFTGNAADLLDQVHGFLRDYVAFPSDAAAVAVTLWAVHTHLAAAFDSTPRLALLSPEKQCGKTRVLELLELLCPGAERLSDASPAYMFRRIGAGAVTVLLDECDALWKRGKADEAAEALRSIVNAGHRKGAFVGRAQPTGKGVELLRFPVYAPTALAGIGDCLPETVLDRSVIVPMRRRAPGETVREFRERTTRPEGEALRDQLAAWAADAADKVGCPWPDMPPGVADRPADVWEPLLMVADLAGGEWPARAREACQAFVTGDSDDAVSLGVRLLADLLDAFREGNEIVSAMSTESILAKLHAMDEAPWSDWYGKPFTARNLAKQLKPYGVKSGTVRIGEETAKGYRRADLWDPWTRYGVLSDTSVTRVTPLASTVTHVTDVTDNPAAACPDVTHTPRLRDGRWLCPDCEADEAEPRRREVDRALAQEGLIP